MVQPKWEPPFNKTILNNISNSGTASPSVLLLPASYRVKFERKPVIVAPTIEYAKDDLNVKRLNDLHKWLWLAGRPMPPRTLSYQQAAARDIIINEAADMHLVWTIPRRIFLKPIPRYLLDFQFWKDNITKQEDFYRSAYGFLLSYAALIQYESDFQIAKEKHLIPKDLSWELWIDLVGQLLKDRSDDRVNIRYDYGELRLSRLNKICWIHGYLRGYSFPYQTYSEFFTANLAPIGVATIYIVLVLTAMQVGLATTQLNKSDAFQKVSSGFAMFSILAPVGLILGVFLLLFLFFFYNWVATVSFGRKVSRDKTVQHP